MERRLQGARGFAQALHRFAVDGTRTVEGADHDALEMELARSMNLGQQRVDLGARELEGAGVGAQQNAEVERRMLGAYGLEERGARREAAAREVGAELEALRAAARGGAGVLEAR